MKFMENNRIVKTVGITVLALAATAALGALLVRDQISRHQRDLFSPNPLERLAALGYLGSRPASVDAVLVLRDFLAWEPRPLLRRRAVSVLNHMERALDYRALRPEGV